MQRITRTVRGLLPGTTGSWKHCLRLYSDVSKETAGSKELQTPQKLRLWGMQRSSQSSNKDRLASKKAWRIPGLIDFAFAGVPAGVGPRLYLDRLQVHQFYWKLGEIAFLCTPFQLEIYEEDWVHSFEKAKVLTCLEVYPHLESNPGKSFTMVCLEAKPWSIRQSLAMMQFKFRKTGLKITTSSNYAEVKASLKKGLPGF